MATPTEGIRITTLLKERYIAVLPEAHPLARRRTLNVKSLEGEPFIMFARRMGPLAYDRTIACCERSGFRPNIVQDAPQWLTLGAAGGRWVGCFAGAGLRRQGCDAGGGLSRSERRMPNVDRSWGKGRGGERAGEELHRSSKSASCELSVDDVIVGEWKTRTFV